MPHVETAVGQLISRQLKRVWFIFSRKGCDQAVEYLCRDAGACLVSREEQIEITKEIDAFVASNKDAVREEMIEPKDAESTSRVVQLGRFVEALFQRVGESSLCNRNIGGGSEYACECTVMSALSKRGDIGPAPTQMSFSKWLEELDEEVLMT